MIIAYPFAPCQGTKKRGLQLTQPSFFCLPQPKPLPFYHAPGENASDSALEVKHEQHADNHHHHTKHATHTYHRYHLQHACSASSPANVKIEIRLLTSASATNTYHGRFSCAVNSPVTNNPTSKPPKIATGSVIVSIRFSHPPACPARTSSTTCETLPLRQHRRDNKHVASTAYSHSSLP